MSRSLAPQAHRRWNAAGFIGTDSPPYAQLAFARNGRFMRVHQDGYARLFATSKAADFVQASSTIATQGPFEIRWAKAVHDEGQCIGLAFVNERSESLTPS